MELPAICIVQMSNELVRAVMFFLISFFCVLIIVVPPSEVRQPEQTIFNSIIKISKLCIYCFEYHFRLSELFAELGTNESSDSGKKQQQFQAAQNSADQMVSFSIGLSYTFEFCSTM